MDGRMSERRWKACADTVERRWADDEETMEREEDSEASEGGESKVHRKRDPDPNPP